MVDFDRAMVLMDTGLFADSFDAMWRERGSGEWTDERAAQCVWDHYCRSHAARYGEPFVPDINPTWDR